DLYVQVPRRTTVLAGLPFARQTDAVAIVHAGRHLDGEGLVLLHASMPMAGRARIGDDRAGAAAARAGLLDGEKALLHAHLADAAAGLAGRGGRSLARPGAVADRAGHHGRHADLDGSPLHRLFEAELQVVTQI